MSTLEEIKKRAENATPGPWFRQYVDVVTTDPDPRDIHSDAPRECRISRRAEHLDFKDAQGIRDADFIAHARTDVPKLVNALERVEALLMLAEGTLGYGAGGVVMAEAIRIQIQEALS